MTGGTALFIDGSSIRVLSFTAHEAAVTAILAASVVLGELLPITVRRGESSEPYTFSGTAAITLIITGPLWIAAVAQMSAGLFDDIRSRRPLVKLSFNVSQYHDQHHRCSSRLCGPFETTCNKFHASVSSR